MNEFDIWFSTVKISKKHKLKLIKQFKTTENIWFYAENKEFYFDEQVNEKKLKMFLKSSWNKDIINMIKDKMYKYDIKLINYHDEFFPKKLKFYDDAPALIFYKGNIKKLNKSKSVAIVGSREYSYYGKNISNILGRKLAENNINVISGMAKGIDSFAQSSCVENNGFTCAILGSGLDVIYPSENRKLYFNILKNGVIISEFIPGTKPYAYNFPLRNRIISALSDLIVVVEASEKSGSLITASYALEQGKDVMAVPGSIFSSKSVGTNKLIKDGAYPLMSLKDIFNILNISFEEKNGAKVRELNGLHKKIYTVIKDEPIHIDDLIRITNIDMKRLYEVLFELQLKNQITCLSGNYYVRIANSV